MASLVRPPQPNLFLLVLLVPMVVVPLPHSTASPHRDTPVGGMLGVDPLLDIQVDLPLLVVHPLDMGVDRPLLVVVHLPLVLTVVGPLDCLQEWIRSCTLGFRYVIVCKTHSNPC